jgi:hypothetical protein
MSQVLWPFRLLDFTMLRPVLCWRAGVLKLTKSLFNFPFFLGRGEPRINETAVLNPWIRG